MKMLAQMMQKQAPPKGDGERMITAFIKEINRVDALVNDLSLLSGTRKYQFEPVSPYDPVEDVAALAGPKLNHLKIKLTLNRESGIPEVRMDRDKIKQVLWNLLMNAVQSMPDGGTIELSVQLINGRILEYRIKDYGAGIAEDDMKQIFAPFYSTKKEGMGIGLYVSGKIADAHQGRIKVCSTPGSGTSVSLLIPAK